MASGKEKTSTKKERGLAVLSLFIAFFVWFVHNMAREYPFQCQYSVEIRTNIQGRAERAVSEDPLFARGHASGLNIFLQRTRQADASITLDVDGKYLVQAGDDVFHLMPADVYDLIAEALGGDMSVDNLRNQPLRFILPEETCRTVPVEVDSYITLKNQYIQVSDFVCTPDSVTVYAPAEVLDGITSVATEPVRVLLASGNRYGNVALKRVPQARLSAGEVAWSVQVERYAEQTCILPVSITGLPNGKNMIVVPSVVTVTYRHLFSQHIDESKLSLEVSYDDFIKSNTKKMIPNFLHPGYELYDVSFEPRIVDCILTDSR